MSYHLTNLIKNLKSEEIRNFRLQENRYNLKSRDKKLTLLFDAIHRKNTDEYEDKLVIQLFPKGNKNAYYRLKNLLTERIEDSLVYLHRNKNEEFEVYRNLQLYGIAFHKSIYKEAHSYLKKAEKIALRLENYDLLILVYRKFIDLSKFLEISPKPYIERQHHYQEIAVSTNETECLIAMLNFKLKKTNFSGKDNEVIDMLEQIKASLHLNKMTTYSTRTKLQINHCIRDILLQKKEFQTLAEYMINSYEQFKMDQIFGKNNHEEKIVQLSWIINSLLKIKNFKDAPQYIDELYEDIQAHAGLYYEKYMWLYYQARITEYSYSKKYREAIHLLKELEQKKLVQNNSSLVLYVQMNMTILNYTIKETDISLQYLAKILLSPAFNSMSPDRKLSFQLMELIIRTDNEDIEYAISKSNEIKRKYRSMLKQEQYQIERRFVKIVSSILKKPDALKNKKLLKEANQFITDFSYEPGSTNELIDYSLWLQSKILKKNYYSLIPDVF